MGRVAGKGGRVGTSVVNWRAVPSSCPEQAHAAGACGAARQPGAAAQRWHVFPLVEVTRVRNKPEPNPGNGEAHGVGTARPPSGTPVESGEIHVGRGARTNYLEPVKCKSNERQREMRAERNSNKVIQRVEPV